MTDPRDREYIVDRCDEEADTPTKSGSHCEAHYPDSDASEAISQPDELEQSETDSYPPRQQIARRLAYTGLLDDRFVPVRDGMKASPVDHRDRANRESSFAALEGNYGVYAGPTPDGDTWLVEFDIDDYGDDIDPDALAAVTSLPETFTVASPHTNGDGGGHRFYKVSDEDLADRIAAVTGSGNGNAKPSWGELRVRNQYVVGPGSAITDCKHGCCTAAVPGKYTVATDAPIAEIDADTIIDVLRADGYTETAATTADNSVEGGSSGPNPGIAAADRPRSPTPNC